MPEIKVRLVLRALPVPRVNQVLLDHLEFKDHEVILEHRGPMADWDLRANPDRLDRKVHQEMLDQLGRLARKDLEVILEIKER